MSNKQNKFVPSAGYVVAVHFNALGVRAVAQVLDIFPEVLAEALEKAGFKVVPDPFDLSADTAKLLKRQGKEQTQGLHVVKESDDSDSNASTD